MTDWHHQPASRLLAAMDQGDVSSVELTEHFQSRFETQNAKVNAVVATNFDGATDRAKLADAARAKGENWGPLHGLPMTIKDALEVAGMPAVGGAPMWKDHRPAQNADAVQRILDAGAVIFGKTNVPFMSGDLQTYNDVYGTTNNPWDVTCGPGGSSGGAAAALAAGLTPLELGSDIGGSIRTPAHLCGVYGHKPTYGIVSKRGHLPGPPGTLSESDLSVVGPLGLSAADLGLLLDVVAAPNSASSVGWNLSLPQARATMPKDLRVAVWLDDPYCEIDAQSINLMTNAANALKDAGAEVDFAARPDFTLAEITEIYLVLLHSVTTLGMPEKLKEKWRSQIAQAAPSDKSHEMLQARGGVISHAEWLGWNEMRAHVNAKWAAFFRNYDVVLCPTLARPAFPHDQTRSWSKRKLVVNGKDRHYMDVLIWAGPAVLSYLPASVAPVGLTNEGLPVGVQIIGPYLEDKTPIAVAGMIEELVGGFRAPPDFS
ncbi:acylamidase [Rhodobiaceae bacterium]|nr:acylamidase [Rhodobiaceae bacterium]